MHVCRYQLVYEMESDPCKMESDDDPIYRMEQSIAKIVWQLAAHCYEYKLHSMLLTGEN